MGRYLLFFSLIFSLFLTACGPSTTARQNEKDQEKAILDKQKVNMGVAEGKWIGCLRDLGANLTDNYGLEFDEQIAADKGRKPKPPPDPIEVPKNPIPPLPPDKPTACTGGKGIAVVLQILVVDMLQPDPTRNEVVEVPTLTGLFKTAVADETNVVFTSGLFDEANGHIQLSSTAPVSVGNTGTLPGVSAPTIMRLQLMGDTMIGQFVAPQKIADVEFHRVKK